MDTRTLAYAKRDDPIFLKNERAYFIDKERGLHAGIRLKSM
jgi:hypothetical protein